MKTRTEIQSGLSKGVYGDRESKMMYRAIQGNDLIGYDASPWTTNKADAEAALAAMVKRGTAWCDLSA